MPISRNNNDEAKAYIKRRVEMLMAQIEKALNFAGLRAVSVSRLKGNYTDRTGNLRSSIGYAIIYNGEVKTLEINDAGTEGVSAGEALAKEVASEYNTGYQLVIIAGMYYARYVAAKGYDVIDSGEIQAKNDVKQRLEQIMNEWRH